MVIALKTLLLVTLLVVSLVPVQDNPCVLIDTGHGGYPLKDGRLSEFQDYAAKKGFSVDFEEVGDVNLHKYCLVLSVNPDILFSHRECDTLKEYVVQGGTFFLTGAGDYENRDHTEVTNPLLEALRSDIRFNDDQITDSMNSGKSYIPLFDQWRPHPLTGGLPPISLYSPESVTPGKRGYPLLQGNKTTKSKDTDGFIEPVPETVTLLAVQRIGKGNLLVGGSWGFVSGLTFQGHQKFIDKLLQYVSRVKTISSYYHVFQGASIVIGEKCRPEVDKKGAEILSELLCGEITSQRSDLTVIIGGPCVNPFCEEINPYLPIQFGKDHTWYITKDGRKLYGQEYSIIAAITVDNQNILVVAGLGGTGTAGAVNLLEKIDTYSLLLTYNEYGEAVLVKVSGDANHNGVKEASESWHISIL